MGKFEVTTRKNGEFQFRLKAGNGQIILSSEGYSSKSGSVNGIESVRKNCQDDSKYDKKTNSNGKPYFCLKATNGQIIGNSEMYDSVAGRDNGIESVKKNAPDAVISDLTLDPSERQIIEAFGDRGRLIVHKDKEEPFQSFESDDISLFLSGRQELDEIIVMNFLKSVKIYHLNVLKEFLQENKDLCI